MSRVQKSAIVVLVAAALVAVNPLGQHSAVSASVAATPNIIIVGPRRLLGCSSRLHMEAMGDRDLVANLALEFGFAHGFGATDSFVGCLLYQFSLGEING